MDQFKRKSVYYMGVNGTKTHQDREGWDIANPPCDNCHHRDFCKEGGFSCKDFERYVKTNKVLNVSRRPSIIVHTRLFKNQVRI